MCMASEAERYKSYEKMNSTVKIASKITNTLNVRNLILYHSNDNDLKIEENCIQKKRGNILMEIYMFQMIYNGSDSRLFIRNF